MYENKNDSYLDVEHKTSYLAFLEVSALFSFSFLPPLSAKETNKKKSVPFRQIDIMSRFSNNIKLHQTTLICIGG